MKLRLPHKFQAALMAALASVSFTTLSSGSSAQAWTLDDAALKMYDFTQASVDGASADGWTFTKTVANTDGVFTTTSDTTGTAITHTADWASQITVAGSSRTIWAGVITINVRDLSNANGVILTNSNEATGTAFREGVGYTKSGDAITYTGFNGTARWGNGNNHDITNLEQYADSNGLVTVGVFFNGTGVNKYAEDTLATSDGLRSSSVKNQAMRLSNTAGVAYTNLYVFAPNSATAISQADMQGLMQAAGAYYWAGGTDGNWDAATKNWTHYGSSVAVAIGTNGGNANTNVVFGADATNKSVTLAGATTVGALTVSGGDYTFNLNGNLTTSGITIAEGASLAYAGTGNISGALSGAGTFSLAADQKVLPSTVSLGNDWTGAVRISGSINDLDLRSTTHLYNDHSSVILDGWTGYFTNANEEITADVEIGAGGITLTNGWGANSITFTGALTGSGNINRNNNAKVSPDLRFTGDVSGYTGSVVNSRNDGWGLRLTYSGSANQIKAAEIKNATGATGTIAIDLQAAGTVVDSVISRGSGTININVGTSQAPITATFNKEVSASALTINSNSTATLKETLTLSGSLTLDGSATLEKGGSIGGSIDLSHGGAAHGTLTLAAGQNLTYGSSFWGANNNKLLLGEGATVKQATNAPIEIEGLAGESYVSSNANAQFGLTASAYTLHNVQATINTASDNVQLRFDNSKLVTSQDITLKNLQSVFSGMDIQGGTTTVGASDAGTVTLGAVTLSGGGNLALAAPVTGNVSSINVAGTSAISGGTLSMGGTITTGDSAQLTLGGTVLIANGGITSSGTGSLAFGDSVVFDLSQLTEDTATHTYTLFTGNAVDLTGLNTAAADHIAGVLTTGRSWTFNDHGQVSYVVDSHDLVWGYGLSSGTWSTSTSDMPWTLKSDPNAQYFSNGDNVSFTEDMIVAAEVTLGSDVTAASMTLEDGDAVDVTVNNGGGYTLNVDELDILGGRLTTNTAINVKVVNIESAGVWNVGRDLDLTTIAYSNEGTLNVMSGATVNISKDTDTSAITGQGILNLSVGTEVIQGYAPTFKEGSPFTGTLVYNEGNIGNHNSYVTLDNTFQGTLELRGRMDGSAMNLGGATTLRLVGDRATNTTGIWSHGNNMTFNLNLEVTGDNTVDLWGDTTTIINGTVNSGTVKQGHLSKTGNGTMTFNGAVALTEYTTPGGTVNFNSSADLDRININGGTVNLAGGAEADYSLGQAWLSGGNLAIGANGVKSLTAADLVVRSSNTLSSAAATPTEFNVTRFDVSNYNTNFTLQNVTLNVSGEATAAVLNTAQNEDQATVTVGDKATLNLDGGVVWNKQDTEHSKLDYVDLTINNGGEANVNTGTGNILNAATVNAGGQLNFKTGTSTEIKGTLTVGGIVDNSGAVTFSTGTVATGQVGTLTGSGTYNLTGTLATEGTGILKIADATIHGATGAAITGNVEIAGGTFTSPLTLGADGSTITVTKVFNVDTTSGAEMVFDGTMVLDALESTGAAYSGGQQSTDNGFLTSTGTVTVFNVLDEGGYINMQSLGTVTYKGAAGFLAPTGTFTAAGGDNTIFHVRAATATAETYSYAQSVHPDTFNAVSLDAAGVAFNIDSTAAALTKLTVMEAASGTVTIGDSATIDAVETGNGLTFVGSGTLTLGTDGSATAAISGPGALTFNGPAVTLYGDNSTFTGDLTINGGTVTVGDDLALGSMVAGTRTVKLAGGTLDVNGHEGTGTGYTVEFAGGKLTNTGTSRGSGNRQLVAFATITADSEISNATGHEMGFGTAGFAPITVTFENGAKLDKTGTGTFWVSNATVSGEGGFKVSEGTLHFQQGGTYAATDLEMAGGTVAGTLNLAGNIAIDTTKDSTISAAITGTNRTITKEGTGALTLSGGSSFTGSVLVKEGTVKLGNGNALGAQNNTVTIEKGATVDVNSKDNRIYSYTLNGGSLVNNGDNDTDYNHTQNAQLTLTADSTVGGSHKLYMIASGWGDTTANLNNHTLTKEGTGTFSFVNTDISAGTIMVNQGTVEFYNRGGNNNSNVQANITLNGGTISGAYNYTASDSAVTRNLTVNQSAATSAAITIGNNVTLATTVAEDQVLTLGGAITGTGNFSLSGAGTLKLAGADMISANTLTFNSGSTLDVSNIAQMAGITVNLASYTGSASYSGLNITGVNGGLTYKLTDDGSHVAITFASEPSPTPFTPVVDLGNVMYVGDSITDGEAGQKSWRYSFFQVLADGGIGQTEEGYFQHRQTSGAITTTTYGDRTFENNHSAHTSARSTQTVGDRTGRYDNTNIKNWLGISTEKTGGGTYEGPVYKDGTAPDTYFVLLGTNDTLSEDGGHMSEAFYNQVLGTMYGYANGEFDGTTGTFDKMYAAMMQNNKDAKLVVLEIPTWSPDHRNNNNASDYAYIAKVNQKLHEWADSKHNSNITIVNTNPGILDVANTTKPGAGVATMYADGLHPSAQGELIIAGNVAKQLGYAGRTVGLDRANSSTTGTTWDAAPNTSITVTAGAEAQTFAENAFSTTDGYTIDFGALYGNGYSGGWSDKANALTVQVGDGYNIGTLTFSEAYVMWGGTVLYSRDNSQEGDNFRIAYVNQSVNEEDHVSTGYYVWMGDQLIGEALSGVSGSFNGISLTSTGANGTVKNLTWSDTAYAPTTTLFENPDSEALFHLVQAHTLPTHTDTPQGIKDDIEWQTTTDKFALPSGQTSTAKTIYKEFSSNIGAAYTGAANANYEGDIGMHYTGTADMDARQSVLSVYNATVTGNVYVQLDNPNTVYNSFTNTNRLSVTAGYNGNITGSYTAVYNAGIFNYDVRGGEHHDANATIGGGSYSYVNGGTFKANVMGGGVTGTIDGGTHVTVSGGEIAGSVYGGGIGGTINDGTYVTITGGVIAGNVIGGGTGGTINGGTHVTVEGILPSIKGYISADNVTLKDVVNPQEYVDGFDSYAGTITATTLTLDNYKAGEMLATVTAATLAATNGTDTVINHLTTAAGTAISVDATSSLTLGQANLSAAISNAGTLVLTQDITATGLVEESHTAYRVGADDEKSENGNYFYTGTRTESTIRVVSGEGDLQVADGLTVTQGGHAYTLASDGTATGVSADNVDYRIFVQSEAGSTLNVSDIAATSTKHGQLLWQVAVDSADLVVDQFVQYVQLVDARATNTVDTDFIGALQVAGGDNTLVGSVTSLPGMTQFVQGAAGSLKMQNATATPYQVAAGNDITFADTDSVTIHAAVAEEGSEQFDVYALNNARFTVEANTMQAMNTGNVTVNNHLKVASIATGGAGSLTLANGVEETLKNVTALSGDITFLNMAEARSTEEGSQTQVGLDSLYIGSSKTVSFYENGIVDAAKEASVTVSGTLTAGRGATLNADLEMASGSHLNVSGAQDTMGLLMGSNVTLNSDSYLDVTLGEGATDSDRLYNYLASGEHELYYLFSGTENDLLSLKIDGEQVEQLTFTDWQHFDKDASEVYKNLQAQTFYMVYDGSNVGMVAIGLLPEPTTSTLSLLALCALAARRRRR